MGILQLGRDWDFGCRASRAVHGSVHGWVHGCMGVDVVRGLDILHKYWIVGKQGYILGVSMSG